MIRVNSTMGQVNPFLNSKNNGDIEGTCKQGFTSYPSQPIGSTWTLASRFSSVILLSISGSSRHSNIARFSRVTHTLELSSSAMAAISRKLSIKITVELFFSVQFVHKNYLTQKRDNRLICLFLKFEVSGKYRYINSWTFFGRSPHSLLLKSINLMSCPSTCICAICH